MKLDKIFEDDTLKGIMKKVSIHFGREMRAIRIQMSLFEQYDVRPVDRVWIKGIWEYCIVVNGGKYHFGKLRNKQENE